MPTTLRVIPEDEMAAIAARAREGWSWDAGYPTEGDVIMARWAIDAGLQPTPARPWGPLQVEVDGIAVGGAGFKGAPDDAGTVEIGYGIVESRSGRGIATEAVRQLVSLALSSGAVRVIAETDVDNVASQRVLIRCGFRRFERPDFDTLWWEYDGTSA